MSRVFVLVDYQNDFVTGSLGFEKAKLLEKRLEKKVNEYLERGDYVFCTFDTHYENYLETKEGRGLAVKHCIFGTDGWNLYGSLRKFQDDARVFCVKKEQFGSLLLPELIKKQAAGDVSEIEIAGVVTDICVLSNAVILSSAFPEAKITVDSECVATADDCMQNKALDILRTLMVNVI